MIKYLVLYLGLTLLAARILVLSLPAFAPTLETSFFANVSVGMASDFALTFVLGFLFFNLDKVITRSKSWKKILSCIAVGISLVFVLSVYAHVRYVEYFGMTIRPADMFSVQTEALLLAIPSILFGSWRFHVLWSVPIVLTIVIGIKWPRSVRSLGKYPLIYLVMAVIFNSLNINMRHISGVHDELRYNPFAALYFGIQDYRDIIAMPLPSSQVLIAAREEFLPNHVWSQNLRLAQYPLWQQRVFTPAEPNSPVAKIREEFVRYLKAEESANGPWNVVVVMLGGARALEIGYLNPPGTKGLSPGLDQILPEGISFTEAIATGSHSKHGQIAAICSLYAFPSFPLMIAAPTTNARCLPDILRGHGYETYFFHAADNHFNYQDVFYRHHETKTVIGQADFPKGTSEGAWGYSDHALFDKVLANLKLARAPFYATILGLTNYPPYLLPSDAPIEINREQGKRERAYGYMDWSFSTFYREYMQAFPHTIMIVLADQGVTFEERIITENIDYDSVRRLFRMPFTILTGNMPENLRGTKISTVVSNVDVPPTLLSILGIGETEQQFMGMDAFLRTDHHVYTNWFETFLKVSTTSGKPTVGKVAQISEQTIGAIGQYNLYAPPAR
jgi:phosphoglycerol transferase MdoB-like AlkP superfamily enzyme